MESQWYAVWTRSRHERKVSAALQRKGIEVFLPEYQSRRQWSDRCKTLALPFFPGYTFVNVQRDRLWQIGIETGVVRVVGINGSPTPVPSDEIIAVRTVLALPDGVDLYPSLPAGELVVITRGPLRGVRGTFLRWQGKFAVVVAVNLLNQGAAVHLSPDMVAPVG